MPISNFPAILSGGAGTGTVTTVGGVNLTSTAIVTGGGSKNLQTPNVSATMDASGNISTPGSLTTGAGSAVAGSLTLGQGTLPALGTTAVTIGAPAAVTSYERILEGAVNSSGFYYGTVSGTTVTDTKIGSTGSGNVVLATSGTMVTPILGTPTSGNLVNCTADGTNSVGYLIVPQNAQSTTYVCVLGDAGKSIDHPASDGTARTYTIPANSSVAYTIGTCISFSNMSTGSLTIAITSDTMNLSSSGSSGSRTLAQYGVATARKVASTVWLISGTGLT